ncbi:MAG: FAD/NAD(P)-binding protein [Bacillota bacterium]
MQRIAIIGAGFSGAATAIQLLRRHGDKPLHLTLINRHPKLARGVAYGTHSPTHFLNVPAARMSLFPDDEGDFLRYARHADPKAEGGSFLPRARYGEYLLTRLKEAAAGATASRFESRTGEVTHLELVAGGARLHFADGGELESDRVVLASGNYPPTDPWLPDDSVYRSARYIRDPWAEAALDAVDPSQPVLLIGTGLTMMDVALELDRRDLSRQMFALSRRGLMPLPHRDGRHEAPDVSELLDELRTGRAAIRRYLRVLRRYVVALGKRGADWRDLLAALRPHTAELWQSLDEGERRRFLRHVQPYWDTHRHRTAPDAHALLQRLIAGGRLTVRAGRLLDLKAFEAKRIELTWRPRGGSGQERLEVGTVINCTGPQGALRRSSDPLIKSLLRQGLLTADPLNLGLEVDAAGAILDQHGRASATLFYTGPLLKARDWECTAVPELRVAAQKLADTLVASFSAGARARQG